MNDLLMAAATYFPATLGPLLLLLLAPTSSSVWRAAFAALLGVGAIALVGVAMMQTGQTATVEVINPFLDPSQGKPVHFVVEEITAPGWHWPLVAAVLLVIAGLTLFATMRRAEGSPRPVLYCSLLTVWMLAARLGLEKTGAPQPLVWALGVTIPTVVMLPFVGAWVGARGHGFGRLVGTVLLLGLVQRAMVVGIGFLATTQGLGTHLDVRAIRQAQLPLGHRDFTGAGDQAFDQWLYLIAIPQGFWVLLTVVGGLLLASVPFLMARRRS